jgi:hypothetical protein
MKPVHLISYGAVSSGCPTKERVTEHAAVRPIRGTARPTAVGAIPAEPSALVGVSTTRVEPEVTSALPRNPEPLASPPTAAKGPSPSDRASKPAGTPPPSHAQPAASKAVAHHGRLRMQRAAGRPRVHYARLRAQPGAWRRTAGVRPSRIAAAPASASPIGQLFQFFLGGGR